MENQRLGDGTGSKGSRRRVPAEKGDPRFHVVTRGSSSFWNQAAALRESIVPGMDNELAAPLSRRRKKTFPVTRRRDGNMRLPGVSWVSASSTHANALSVVQKLCPVDTCADMGDVGGLVNYQIWFVPRGGRKFAKNLGSIKL